MPRRSRYLRRFRTPGTVRPPDYRPIRVPFNPDRARSRARILRPRNRRDEIHPSRTNPGNLRPSSTCLPDRTRIPSTRASFDAQQLSDVPSDEAACRGEHGGRVGSRAMAQFLRKQLGTNLASGIPWRGTEATLSRLAARAHRIPLMRQKADDRHTDSDCRR